MEVSIPQAVSTVATLNSFGETFSGKKQVSIPQAVSTVATRANKISRKRAVLARFNTASGKHCCNDITDAFSRAKRSFNTASGKHCCNLL